MRDRSDLPPAALSGAQARPPAEVRLGALRLRHPIGEGGMGEVWEAWHPGEGLTVAVKVMTVSEARRAQARAAFSREVEAIARMDHPHIVRVHDHGLIGAEVAEQAAGRLREGQPYLVMERAPGGTLVERCGRAPWSDALRILRALLAALAHAHARGVVHLDLKPENVLMSRGDQPRLADFGLAQAMGEAAGLRAGTPAYMAPEQVRGGRMGPWTDLYALGHLGWTLVHGAPAFPTEPEAGLRAQLSAPLPAFQPLVATPEGLEPWLRRLLQRRPSARFSHAADALAALNALGPATLLPGGGGALRPSPSGASTFLVTDDWAIDPSFSAAPVHAAEPLAARALPPLPSDWRGLESEAGPRALEGLGLRTFGLREVPLVGREAARDQLWAATRDPAPRCLLIHGMPGSGRRLLLRWLARQVESAGAAFALHRDARPLRDQLSQRMGWAELSPPALSEALTQDLFERRDAPVDALLLDAALEWLRPGAGRVRLSERAAQRAVAARVLVSLAAPRRLLYVVDAEDEEGLALGRALLQEREAPGPLVLAWAGVWPPQRALEMAPTGSRLPLPLFEADALRALLARLIRLDFPLAERLVNASNGNLEYLLEVIQSWIAQGDLQPGPGGFTLRDGASTRLPRGTRGVRERRMETALAEGGPRSRRLLALLALGAARVHAEDLSAAARAAGLGGDLQALRPLERSGVVFRDLDQIGFVDGGFRALALELAPPEARPALHEAWTRAELRAPLSKEQLGEHLLGAGRPGAAAEQLVAAATVEWDHGDATRTLDVIGRAREALRLAQTPAPDPRWGELRMLEAASWHSLGRLERAAELSQAALDDARAHGWPTVQFEALRRLGALRRMRGRSDQAEVLVREALATLPQGEDELRGWGLLGLSQALRHQGRLSEAVDVAADALALAGGSALLEAEVSVQVGALLLQRGALDEAEPLLLRALGRARAAGRTDIYSSALLTVAELHTQRGELELAEAGYRECLALAELRGERLAVTPRLNVALIAMKRGQWESAREDLLRSLATLRRQGRDTVTAVTLVFLMACAASTGAVEELRDALEEAEQLMAETGSAFPDGVEWGRLAQREAARAGLREEAERVRVMIDALEARLGR